MSEASDTPVTKPGAIIAVPEAAPTPAGSEEIERLRSEVVRQRARADKAEAIAAERSGRIDDLRQAMRMLEAANPQRAEEPHEVVESAPTPAPAPPQRGAAEQAKPDPLPDSAAGRFEQAVAGDTIPWTEIVERTFGTGAAPEPPAPSEPAEQAKPDRDPLPWEELVEETFGAWQAANRPASKPRGWLRRTFRRRAT